MLKPDTRNLLLITGHYNSPFSTPPQSSLVSRPSSPLRVFSSLQRLAQRFRKQVVIKRFAQERHRARSQRAFAHSRFVVGCDEDNGKWLAIAHQTLLHLQPV